MNGLYPIIRRRRVPLLPMEAPAGGGQTGRGQGAVAGAGAVTSPPGTLPKVDLAKAVVTPPGEVRASRAPDPRDARGGTPDCSAASSSRIAVGG